MKGKFFTILTAILLTLVLLPSVAFADAEVPKGTETVTEPIDIAADSSSRSGNGWAWDSSSNTLTLNGLQMEISPDEDCMAGILLPDGGVNIVLQDSSQITISGEAFTGIKAEGPLSISGSEEAVLRIDGTDGANCIEADGPLDVSNTRLMTFGTHFGIHCATLSLTYTQLSAEAEKGIAVRIDSNAELMKAGPAFAILDDPDNVTTYLDLYGEQAAFQIFGDIDEDFIVSKNTVIPEHMGDPDGVLRIDGIQGDDFIYEGFTEYGFYVDENNEIMGAASSARFMLLHASSLYLDYDAVTIHTNDTEVPSFVAYVSPYDAFDDSVTWHSEDPSVVDVVDGGLTQDGRPQENLIINGLGTTHIVAVANDDTVGTLAAACEVTVTDTYLYVGNTAVKESGQIAEGIFYDAESNTLTLDNAVVDGKTLGTNPAVIYCEGFRDFTGAEYAEGNALITYSRKTPLNIIVKGENVFNEEGIEDAVGIAIESFAAGETVLTGPVTISGENGASLEFKGCSLASFAGSDVYLPPEGSTEDEEVPSLDLHDITVEDEDSGSYGIVSGRCTNFTNVVISVANKEIFGIRTGNLLKMADVDINVRDIGNIGIYASGSGYSMESGTLKVTNTGYIGLSAPSIGHISGGEVVIDNANLAMTAGQYFAMYDGSLTITNAHLGLYSSLTGTVYGGTIRIDTEGYAMNTGKTAIAGGDIVLTSEGGFALMAPGSGDKTAGFIMEGGTLELSSKDHAAFMTAFGQNVWAPAEIVLPEGGKFLSETPEDLGIEILTVADKDTEEISVDYTFGAIGPEILDIKGGADHVIFTTVTHEYEVVSGDGSTWTKGSEEGLEIVIEGTPDDDKTFERFNDAFLDYARMDTDAYEIKAGSLVMTLKPEFLETLDEGEHSLKVAFLDDGFAEATFTVAGGEGEADSLESTPKPETGSNSEAPAEKDSRTGLWIGIAVAAAAAICGGTVYSKKKKK